MGYSPGRGAGEKALIRKGLVSEIGLIKPEIIVQSGHINSIISICFSPDSSLIATASPDETIRLWDLRIGCELRVLTGHTGPVYSVRFSPDGRLLASCSFDKTARLWEVATGRQVHMLAGLSYPVEHVSFDATGAFLAAVSQIYHEHSQVCIWKIDTGEIVRRFDFNIHSDFWHQGFALNPEGTVLATYAEEADLIFLHDVAGGGEVSRLPVQKLERNNNKPLYPVLSFTPDGQILVVATGTAPPQLVNPGVDGQPINLPTGRQIYDIEIQPDGTFIGYGEGAVELWDLQNLKLKQTIPIDARCISPNHKLAASHDERTLILWDTGTGKEIYRLGSRLKISQAWLGNLRRLFTLASNPIYPMVASGAPDGYVRLWNLRGGQGPHIFKAHENIIGALAFGPQGTLLASGGTDGFIKLWDAFSGTMKYEIPFKSDIGYLAFSPDGRFLAAAGIINKVLLLDLQKKTIREFEHGLKGNVTGVIFEPNGINFVVTDQDQMAYLNVQTLKPEHMPVGAPVAALAASYSGILAIAHSQNKWLYGQMAAYDENLKPQLDSAVMLLDPQTGQVKMLRGFSPYVRDVAFHPEGNQLATACGDGSVNLWNLNQSDKPHVWQAHAGDVTGIAYTSDGRFLVTIGMDSAVRFWRIDTRKLTATMVSLTDSDYVVVTDEGNYTATRGGLQGVVFRLGDRALPFDQFDVAFNQPDRVHETLGYAYHDTIESYVSAYQHRLQKLGFSEMQPAADFDIPVLSLLSAPPPLATKERLLTMRVRIESSRYSLDRLFVYINDVPIPNRSCIDLRGEDATIEREITINLSAGDNKIQLSALNTAGTESIRETLRISCIEDSPVSDLYILAIGVSEYEQCDLNLKYAGKDASDLVTTIQDLQTHFSSVKSRVLTDLNATKEAILASRSFLEKTSIDDQVIIFFAGHGILDGSDYYFLPSNFNTGSITMTGLHYDEIEALMDGIPARRRLVLLDTCHAGEADYAEPGDWGLNRKVEAMEVSSFRNFEIPIKKQKGAKRNGATDRMLAELFADLRRSCGAFVIAASGAAEYAIEGGNLQNGVFTYCVLEALRNADSNKDGSIRVSELHRYVSEQVMTLTGGQQRPISRRENLTFDFPVI